MMFDWLSKAQVVGKSYKWVRGGVFAEFDEKEQVYDFFIHDLFGNIVPIDPSTICHCTGCSDKNAMLIFDGDYLKIDDSGEQYLVTYVANEAAYKLFGTKGKSLNFRDILLNECEVMLSAEDYL